MSYQLEVDVERQELPDRRAFVRKMKDVECREPTIRS